MTKSTQLQTGEKFNRLTIIKLEYIKEYITPKGIINNKEYYLCKCDCGKEKIVLKSDLKRFRVKSCGCFRKELCINRNYKHGIKKINKDIYSVYTHIKQRCYNKNDKHYNNYGGRGITMCDEWLNENNGIINFYNWAIANGYQLNLQIDRIDNNGNYEPNNCRFITRQENCRNKRNNHLITYNGETHCISEWSEILKIKNSTLKNRINKQKLTIEKAFTTPII